MAPAGHRSNWILVRTRDDRPGVDQNQQPIGQLAYACQVLPFPLRREGLAKGLDAVPWQVFDL